MGHRDEASLEKGSPVDSIVVRIASVNSAGMVKIGGTTGEDDIEKGAA